MSRVDDEDGYYARTRAGYLLGPMGEGAFESLRRSRQKHQISSAYRLAGGQPYPISLKWRLKFDREHVCSCRAFSHAIELFIVLFCFACTAGVMVLLRDSKQARKEREHAGRGTTIFICILFVLTIVMVIATGVKLVQRWRRESVAVFSSEV